MNDDLLLLPPAPPSVPVHRWGTVTQASPLRVQLDGDDGELLSDPWDMAGPRSAGERVYCQIANRRVVIVGPSNNPAAPVDLTPYLNTAEFEPYASGGPAATAVRWGPLIFINGALKVKTGNSWIGATSSTSGKSLFTNLPLDLRLRPGTGSADAGMPRQPLSGTGSWYVYTSGSTPGTLAGNRVLTDGTAVSVSTWFPFGVWGYAENAF